MINIALLGFGTVGKGTYEILERQKEEIKEITGEEIVVKKILKRNLDFETSINRDIFTNDYTDIIEDDEIKLIAEMTGDVDSSYKYIKEALLRKKHIVTANKAVVSENFEEFLKLAKENNVNFLYESSVAGSIPIIKPLKDQSIINNIKKIRGILNGTSNFLLYKMTEENYDYSEVLKMAQEMGFAESDPTDDVEGIDALRKLRILSTIAFKASIKNEDIDSYGISSISKVDIEYLKEKNKKIKLIAESKIEEDKFMALVEPVILNSKDNLANIANAENSVEISGQNYGSLTFIGEGAGMLPTGNAVVTDILDAITNNNYNVIINKNLKNNNNDFKANYYIRVKKDVELNNITLEEEIFKNYKIIKTKEIKRKELINSLKEINKKDYFFARYN
ncbi:homoserine dehydrogenase [Peptoniphilus stercorisuis]|uniref:Homoserine dehydrogenase n=1 Tax=Peptoniphilus stercorisuis TaxID=1436965 RepID=A0ABS4KD76_9FIRM|nr:homoserine dehydrogenase [Peptoniphilus stercorisuis]MBP2025717.1 homoserine dehydrogenase [Peptoniphilus stercorisuis]